MRSLVLCALIAFPASVAPAQPAVQPAQAKKELTAVFGKLVDALQRRDTAVLSRIYAPTYSFTIGGGDSVSTLTRAERLQSVAANPDSITVLNLERCDFTLVAGLGLGDCWIRQRNVTGPSSQWTGIFTTVVFVRRAGQWRLLRSHASVNRPRRQ